MEIYDKRWYNNLRKSPLTPPNYVFGIVWPILYVMMFLSLALVLRVSHFTSHAVMLFLAQLGFNLAWSPIFFRLKMPVGSLFVIFGLLGFLAFTILAFYKINPIAAYLLLPYFLWSTFATYLNAYIVYFSM